MTWDVLLSEYFLYQDRRFWSSHSPTVHLLICRQDTTVRPLKFLILHSLIDVVKIVDLCYIHLSFKCICNIMYSAGVSVVLSA